MSDLSDEERAVYDRVRVAHPEPIELKRDEASSLMSKGRIVQAVAGGRGKKAKFRLADAYAHAEAADQQEDAPPSVGHNLAPEIEYGDLVSIIADLNDQKHAIDEKTGRYRSALKAVIEDRTWNKAAFGDILKIARKSETERADYLRSFKMLFIVMCEGKWDRELIDMVDQMQQANGSGNTTPPPRDEDPDFDDIDGATDADEGDDDDLGDIGEGGEAPDDDGDDDAPDTFGDQLSDDEDEPEERLEPAE